MTVNLADGLSADRAPVVSLALLLAEEFEVSEATMGHRLINLGIDVTQRPSLQPRTSSSGTFRADPRCQSVVTILSDPLAKKVTTATGARQQLPQTARPRRLCYRRCSQRQRGGEALVSEWFVSEARYTDT